MHIKDMIIGDIYRIDNGSGFEYILYSMYRALPTGRSEFIVDFIAPGVTGPYQYQGFVSLDGEFSQVTPVYTRSTRSARTASGGWTCPAPGCKENLRADEKACWKCGGKKP